jgi:hypothetical protein
MLKCFSTNVIDDLGPDSSIPEADPEYWFFPRSSSTFCPGITDRFSLVLPLTAQKSLIHFNGTGKDSRYIFCQDNPDSGQSSEYPISPEPGPLNDGIGILFHEEKPYNLFPFIPGESQGLVVGDKVIPAD